LGVVVTPRVAPGQAGHGQTATRPIDGRTPINCTMRVDGSRNADLNACVNSRSVLSRSEGDGISLEYTQGDRDDRISREYARKSGER